MRQVIDSDRHGWQHLSSAAVTHHLSWVKLSPGEKSHCLWMWGSRLPRKLSHEILLYNVFFAFAGMNWHQSKSPLHSFWHLISLSNPPKQRIKKTNFSSQWLKLDHFYLKGLRNTVTYIAPLSVEEDLEAINVLFPTQEVCFLHSN